MHVRRDVSILTLALGALAVPAPPANAVPIGLPPARTLCGGGLGGGTVDAYYDPSRNVNGTPTIWIRPEFTFVPGTPSGYCGVEVVISWYNKDTDVLGYAPAIPVAVGDDTATQPNSAGPWVPITIDCGDGRIDVLITTNYPNISGRGTLVVAT